MKEYYFFARFLGHCGAEEVNGWMKGLKPDWLTQQIAKWAKSFLWKRKV